MLQTIIILLHECVSSFYSWSPVDFPRNQGSAGFCSLDSILHAMLQRRSNFLSENSTCTAEVKKQKTVNKKEKKQNKKQKKQKQNTKEKKTYGTLPVKLIPAKSGEAVTVSPNTGPSAGINWMTPGGRPLSLRI